MPYPNFEDVGNAILDVMDEVRKNFTRDNELTVTGHKALDEVQKVYDWYHKAKQNALTAKEYLELEGWAYHPGVNIEEPAQGAASILLDALEESDYFSEEQLIEAQKGC